MKIYLHTWFTVLAYSICFSSRTFGIYAIQFVIQLLFRYAKDGVYSAVICCRSSGHFGSLASVQSRLHVRTVVTTEEDIPPAEPTEVTLSHGQSKPYSDIIPCCV